MSFELIAPERLMVRRSRINAESDKIRDALEGWTVVRGAHAEVERDVGRPIPDAPVTVYNGAPKR